MNIAINAAILDAKPTGIGTYTINVVNALAEDPAAAAHRFSVYTSCAGALRLSDRFEVRPVPRRVQPAAYPRTAGVFRFAWNQLAYPRGARSSDCCYSPTPHGSFFVPRQVLTIHDLLALHFPDQHLLQYYYYTYALPRLVKRCAAIVVDSECTRNDVVKHLHVPEQNVFIVPLGYDREVFRPLPDAAPYAQDTYGLHDFLLTVGATYPHKNLERLIQAYAALPEPVRTEHPLVVAGGREAYVARLKRLAAAEGLDASVRFLGYVPADDLPRLYGAATALVYPSLYEGFGLPCIEAMACGCPVVASNTSSLPEVCGEAARYVDPASVESISEAIREVLTRADLRNALVQKGLERVKLFRWETTAARVLEIILAVGQGS